MEEEANLVSPDPQGSEGHSDPTQQDLEIERPRRSPYERREPEELPEGALTEVLGGIARLGQYETLMGRFRVRPVTATLPGVDLALAVPQVKLSDCKGPRFSGSRLKETLSPVVPQLTRERFSGEVDGWWDKDGVAVEAPPAWPTCQLAADWRFDQMRATADRKSRSLLESLRHLPFEKQAGALVLLVHKLEDALRQKHPKLTASAAAHFWQSREVLAWLQRRYATMDQAGVLPNLLSSAGDHVMKGLRAYVREALNAGVAPARERPTVAPSAPQATPAPRGRQPTYTPSQLFTLLDILKRHSRSGRGIHKGRLDKVATALDGAPLHVPSALRKAGACDWKKAAKMNSDRVMKQLGYYRKMALKLCGAAPLLRR